MWDPLAVCEIASPTNNRTCIGVAQRGLPCKNLVSKKSREEASRILGIFAMRLPDSSLKSSFQLVSSLLFCKRRHQDQAVQIGQRWYDRLGQSDIQAGSRGPEPIIQSSLSGNRAETEFRLPEILERGRTSSRMDAPGAPRSPSQADRYPLSRSLSTRQCS